MSEYWVSKKQYWCKYCNIWVRDDAPSRRLHETGLKHQGSKERYIRDLYKTGNMAKREREASEKEMARIEAAAAQAHAADLRSRGVTGTAASAPRLHSSAFAKQPSASSSRSAPIDKFSNYSTAEQLGLAEPDQTTAETSYEIEQMVRGRTTAVGAWEEVAAGPSSVQGGWNGPVGRTKTEEEEESENWKLNDHDRDRKRAVRDIYDDDDWDPAEALGSVRAKLKGTENGSRLGAGGLKADGESGGLKREEWSGKIEFGSRAKTKEEPLVETSEPTNPGVKTEIKIDPKVKGQDEQNVDKGLVIEETKPAEDIKVAPSDVEPTTVESASSSLFKKRRPPPSGRKK